MSRATAAERAQTGAAPARVAFDRHARDYDQQLSGEIFQTLRARTHAAFVRAFAPGARLLEIGCGTGIDAAFLAARGCDVVACEPAAGMAGRARSRISERGFDRRVRVLGCGLQDLAPTLSTCAAPMSFDGIVSNFGALNCVEDLAPLRPVAERYLRPRGEIVLVLMSRVCAIESVYFALSGRAGLAVRRRQPGPVPVPVAGIEVPTFYHRTADVRRALAPAMHLVSIEGIGVAVPPPYLEERWQQLPRGVRRTTAGVDALLAGWPPFNRLGDHTLLRFRKRSAPHA